MEEKKDKAPVAKTTGSGSRSRSRSGSGSAAAKTASGGANGGAKKSTASKPEARSASGSVGKPASGTRSGSRPASAARPVAKSSSAKPAAKNHIETRAGVTGAKTGAKTNAPAARSFAAQRQEIQAASANHNGHGMNHGAGQNQNAPKGIKVTAMDKDNLRTAARWARFIAIVQFVALGISTVFFLLVILGLAVGAGAAAMMRPGMGLPPNLAGEMVTMVLVCMIAGLAIVLVSFLPTLYLYRFAHKTLEAVEQDDQEFMSGAMLNIRRYFKFQGVLMLVGMLVYVAIMIGSFIAGSCS